MQVSHHFLQIPRIHAVSQRPHHGPIQGPDYPRLARTPQSQGYSILPQFLQLLSLFHLWIFKNHCCLMNITRKGTTWHFSDECCSAFEALKKAFTTALVLTHWIPDTQITVETDASNYALAAVLSITTPNGLLHPIAFHSRTFSAPEFNYDVH